MNKPICFGIVEFSDLQTKGKEAAATNSIDAPDSFRMVNKHHRECKAIRRQRRDLIYRMAIGTILLVLFAIAVAAML
jgi:hypothetical protein